MLKALSLDVPIIVGLVALECDHPDAPSEHRHVHINANYLCRLYFVSIHSQAQHKK